MAISEITQTLVEQLTDDTLQQTLYVKYLKLKIKIEQWPKAIARAKPVSDEIVELLEAIEEKMESEK